MTSTLELPFMVLDGGESFVRAGARRAGASAHEDGASDAIDAADLRRTLEEMHADSYSWSRVCARGDAAEGTEVLQTAYVKVLSGAACFDGRSSARTWFFGVIRKTAQERRRRALLTGRIMSLLSRARLVGEGEAPLQQNRLETSERVRALREALAKLPERQRQVLTLVFHHDLTLDEASVSLGIAPGSARAHYDRGKRRLRELLSEYEVWHDRA